MNHTLRQRSRLVQAAERSHEPKASRGDYILAAIGIVGMVVMLVLNLLGVE